MKIEKVKPTAKIREALQLGEEDKVIEMFHTGLSTRFFYYNL